MKVGCDLLEYINAKGMLEEYEAIPIFAQLLYAVQHCHSHLIAHRDLKPENVLLQWPHQVNGNNRLSPLRRHAFMRAEAAEVRLADFGLATRFQPCFSLQQTFCGSPAYAAPEMVLRKSYIGPEVDVWSLGVTLYVMLTGAFPWHGETPAEWARDIVLAQYPRPRHISRVAWDILKRMLHPDPYDRATVIELLEHPWLRDQAEDDLRNTGLLNSFPYYPNPEIPIFEGLVTSGFPERQSWEHITQHRTSTAAYQLYHAAVIHKPRAQVSIPRDHHTFPRRLKDLLASFILTPCAIVPQSPLPTRPRGYSLPARLRPLVI